MDATTLQTRTATAIIGLLLLGCSSSDGEGAPAGSTGTRATSSAGATGTLPASSAGNGAGGAAGGGSLSSAWTSAGGVVGGTSTLSSATGGAISTGGTSATGSPGAGGSSGATSGAGIGGTSQGGQTSGGTGGTGAPGGTTATGGSKTNGGTAATGGGRTSGGTTATGGTSASGGTTSTGSTGPLPSVTIYLAGDSTVSTYTDTAATNDQAGWGQMLREIFNNKVTVENRAAGGRTAYWFYLEGAADKILSSIKAGDYFFIQFGTNDQNETATFTVGGTTYPRYAEAGTTFKTHLKKYYLDPTKAKKAIPVLVTPPPRNSAYCNGGNGLSAYATAMIELAAAENVAVLDNNGKTFSYLKAVCPKPTTASAENFFFGKSDGSIDGTHFQENGARKMAGFLGEEIKRLDLGLAAYLK